MSQRINNFKLGLFVLAGIVLFLAALFIFGASNWFEGKTVEETYVAENVDGLKTGAPVTLRGVPVGEVTRINFTWNVYDRREPRYVYVEFEVHNNISLVPPGGRMEEHVEEQVEKGLRARVKSQGVAGATILSLEYVNPKQYPPLPVPWKPRHMYIPSAPSQFMEILASLDKTMGNLKQLDFKKLGGTLQEDLATAGNVLHHVDQANVGELGTNLNSLLGQFTTVGTNVNSWVEQLKQLSTGLQAFIGTNSTQTTNLPELAARADQVLGEMRATVGRLEGLTRNLDVSSLNETLAKARRASAELEQVARELKQYPAGALFGRPPPPARSVEPTGR